PLLIPEGMSCCGAAHDLGFFAVGRPSATGGLEHLKVLTAGRHACILGENDESGVGRRAAQKLASDLLGVAASVKVIFPPEAAKDLREWYTAPSPVSEPELRHLINRT